MITVSAAGRSDIGRVRERNEDSFMLSEPSAPVFWAVVCDGMGGHIEGDVASREAAAGFAEAAWAFAKSDAVAPGFDAIEAILRSANARVVAAQSPEAGILGMGATLASLFIDRRGGTRVFIAHAGDSRVYRLRSRKMARLTTDHNIAEDLRRQGLVDIETRLAPRYGAQITRFMGMVDFPVPEIAELEIETGDLFLLCTDGLSNVLGESAIASLMEPGDPAVTVDRLIQAALDAGAPDNITAVAVKCGPIA